jgi:hypothetical protein
LSENITEEAVSFLFLREEIIYIRVLSIFICIFFFR